MASVRVTINGTAITADNAKTILQVARDNGIDIPTLCYDPRLPPYGSCLVCVVEVRSAGRLLMSCTTPVAEGMEIWTDSVPAAQARKAALEMLLSSHYADCRGPCFLQCPANVDVQGYLAFAAAGMYREALDLIRETNPMPLSWGRGCVRYCEANCRRKDVDSPGAINFMKRYVADLEFDNLPKPVPVPTNGKKVAVIGGGPAGLTCGYFLRQKGYEVTLLDKQPKLGGMLRYGIPEYRLPQAVLDKEIDYLVAHGIAVRTGVKLGREFTLDSLKADGFDAIYLAMGSWVAKGMGIENETHERILPGIVYLEGCKRDTPPKKMNGTVAIVGGGNTAIDAARTAIRCGAGKVTILYRRTRQEMPADDIEVEDAIEEGVEMQYLVAPKKAVIDNGVLVGLECFRMELGEPDASGRRRPVQVKGSEFLFKADWVVSAIGQEQDLSGLENKTLGAIKLTKWNSIDADPETLRTSVQGVFTGGDVMTGPAAAIDAIGAGRKAAWVIDRWLSTGRVDKFQTGFMSKRTSLAPLDAAFFEQFLKIERGHMPKIAKDIRARNWEEVDTGVTEAQVKHETSRCLSCGCGSVFDCDLKVFSGNYDARQERFKGKLKKHKMDERHPYILLDSNKCILCGRCVRYCGELIGVHALGFINRGYDTVVKPALDKPLAETPCISCGNCIEVCPTGAITFKADLDKPGPFRTVPCRSVCSFCGVGCEIDVNHRGRSFFFVTGKPADPFTEGELCAKGRFGTQYVGARDRLYSPVLKGKGNVGMHEAAKALSAGLKKYKGDEILFLASARVSNEAAYLFGSLAKKHGTRFVFAAEDLRCEKLPDVSAAAGFNGSTATQDDLAHAGVVVTVGAHAFSDNPVLGFKIRRAINNGARLVHVGPADKTWKRLAAQHLDCATGEEAQVLSALCGALVRAGTYDTEAIAGAVNGKQFLDFDFAQVTPEVAQAAALCHAVKVVAVVNADATAGADAAPAWAADLALLCGGGLLVVRNDANGQGFRDVVYGGGVSGAGDIAQAAAAIRAGAIKAVVTFGVDLAALDGFANALAGVAFMAAIDLFKTGATEKADLTVPLCPIAEEDGSVVSMDGRIIKYKKAFKPLAGFTNLEFLTETLVQSGGERHDMASVRKAIAAALPLYATLTSDIPNVCLRDEVVKAGAKRSFCLAPVIPGARATPYAPATTYSRVWEPKVISGNRALP
jgi:formate dehydrogenase major subunit